MKGLKLALIGLVVALGAPAEALTPSPTDTVVGTYALQQGGKRVKVVVRPDPADPQALELLVAGTVRGRASRQPGPTGWRFALDGDPLGTGASQLNVAVSPEGDLVGPGLRLRLQRRILLVPSWEGEDDAETGAFRNYARQVGQEYRKRGYAGNTVQVDSVEQLIAYLLAAEAEGRTFDRIVFIGHGGWDGPMMGPGWDRNDEEVEQQASAEWNPELWERFVDAVRRATPVSAKIYASSCHAGGSNRYERAEADDNPYVWSDDLARRTGRVAAGPAGKTSTAYTLQQMLAILEGEGRAAQETRWASPEGGKTIGYRRGLASSRLVPWSTSEGLPGGPVLASREPGLASQERGNPTTQTGAAADGPASAAAGEGSLASAESSGMTGILGR